MELGARERGHKDHWGRASERNNLPGSSIKLHALCIYYSTYRREHGNGETTALNSHVTFFLIAHGSRTKKCSFFGPCIAALFLCNGKHHAAAAMQPTISTMYYYGAHSRRKLLLAVLSFPPSFFLSFFAHEARHHHPRGAHPGGAAGRFRDFIHSSERRKEAGRGAGRRTRETNGR